jgi:hypothetical protein
LEQLSQYVREGLQTLARFRVQESNSLKDSTLRYTTNITVRLTRALAIAWCGVVWCGVVWCGVVWCGVVWCGVVWCGVVWCGVVWCGSLWISAG